MLAENEHLEQMGAGISMLVSDRHTFGTDALLLARFAAPKMNAVACDFGTGCGVIPFYWLANGLRRVFGVELQAQAAALAARSIEMNGLSDRFTLIEGDLRDADPKLRPGSFDLVTMNPPYTKQGAGIDSPDAARRLQRQETATLPEIASAANRLLRFGGSFCLCLRPERLAEAICVLTDADLAPKRLRLVSKTDGAAPWLFLLEGKKGRRHGLVVEPELHIYGADGQQGNYGTVTD
ncbi:MAG: methyltransferase [Clostridia bacterium]|nr:methyltransferase [Clostridia bacterium]MBR0536693.1 methyltransferase [Clostridia bacterium]